MKLKSIVFKILSMLSLISFYVFSVLGSFVIIAEAVLALKPDSSFAKSYGFTPEYFHLDINFYHEPDLYSDQAFRFLNLFSVVTTVLLVVLMFWYLHKLLKNIHKDNVFMYENATVIFRIGLVFLTFGTLTSLANSLMESRAVQTLQVKNAEIGIVHMSYLDFLITGIVLMAVSVSLKKAVAAVEENKDTI